MLDSVPGAVEEGGLGGSAAWPARRAPSTTNSQSRLRAPALVIWMIVAIAAVASLAYWDEQREARAALDDFADDQAWLAQALSRALVERFSLVEREAVEAAKGMADGARPADHIVIFDDRAAARKRSDDDRSVFLFEVVARGAPVKYAVVPVRRLLSSVSSFERPGDVCVLLRPPGRRVLIASDGSAREATAISAAAETGLRSVRISRGEAAEIGLPPRMAMAGLASVDGAALGTWHVAVVATAQSERDRELRARARLLLSVGVVTGLVVAFGGAALRRRTKELDLRHALAINAIETDHDERLVRADKLATLGALAMGIAHEVSTPLCVIMARAEQIATRPDADDRIRRNGALIVTESERINEVIRGFLALARGNAPILDDALPAALARNAMELVLHRFAKAGVTLDSQLDDDAPPVACDARLFEQVLVNLLLNACEACKQGGHVDLSVRADGARVAFIVTDDGDGICADDALRATEPFFTTKPEGTGLGLAIANEIIKHHRGSLVLRPGTTGRGTQAVVELLVSRSELAEDACT